jgi:hypothetical protein
VFQGLLWDARSGDRLHIQMNRVRNVMPVGAATRGEAGTSFPLAVLERAVLSRLAELDPREILDADAGPDEVAELSAKVTRIDAQLRTLTDLFDGDEEVVPEVADKIRAKNAERKALVDELDRAKAKAASPQSAAWGEARGLIETLDRAADPREIRVRLRHALSCIVGRIDCLFTPGGGRRLAAVQVRFATGKVRHYLIRYIPPHATRGGEVKVDTLVSDKPHDDLIDLRNPEHVAIVEQKLKNIAARTADTAFDVENVDPKELREVAKMLDAKLKELGLKLD